MSNFKHGKLEDSFIMRSFIKEAQAKGLIKSEAQDLQKVAKKEVNKPTSLAENIVTLCSELRKVGLNKYASELEVNFLNYKAASKYKDVDPDIIEQAHPEGSHHLKGVAGDNVIETILEKHLKMLEVANKSPVGKLAKEIIREVKVALGEEGKALEQQSNDLYTEAGNYFKAIEKAIGIISKYVDSDDLFNYTMFSNFIKEGVFNKTLNTSTFESELEIWINTRIPNIKNREAGSFASEEEDAKWRASVLPMVNFILNNLIKIQTVISKIKEVDSNIKVRDSAARTSKVLSEFGEEFGPLTGPKPNVMHYTQKEEGKTKRVAPVADLLNKFESMSTNIDKVINRTKARNYGNYQQLFSWLNGIKSNLNIHKTDLEQVEEEDAIKNPSLLNTYTQYLNDTNSNLNNFKKEWLDE